MLEILHLLKNSDSQGSALKALYYSFVWEEALEILEMFKSYILHMEKVFVDWFAL